MNKWFTSLKGGVTLSVIALITELWRGFLDAGMVIAIEFREYVELAALIFTVLFAGWAWALIVASQGKRSGLIAAFAVNALVLLGIPVSWLFYYCPASCQATAGIFNLANSLNLVFGVLAAISLGFQFKKNK